MPAIARLIPTNDTLERRKRVAPAPPDDVHMIRGMPDLLDALNLGWLSLGLALDSMGVALILVENPDQARLVSRRWIKRERPRNAAPTAGKCRRHADHRSR